uniref:Uncharacterized protein n=1 Tax=Leersia perrieri TaxID=77586 RepID=A0A0D9W5U3_9ORYZ
MGTLGSPIRFSRCRPVALTHMLALISICRLATWLSPSRVQPPGRVLSCCKWRQQARGSNCISCKKITC